MTKGADATIAAEFDGQSIFVRPSRDEDVDAMLAIYLHHLRKGVDVAESPLNEVPQPAISRRSASSLDGEPTRLSCRDRSGRAHRQCSAHKLGP